MRQRPEAALQRTIIAFLKLLPSPDKGGPYWTAINPAPPKGRIQGTIAKSLGAKAGVPDLLLVYRGRAVFVEIKARKGRLSDVQKAAADEITLAGGLWVEVRSLEEMQDFLENLGLIAEGHRVRVEGNAA